LDKIGAKLEDYVDRIKKAEDKEDWDRVLTLCKEYYQVLDTLVLQEKDPLTKNHYYTLTNVISLLRRITSHAKKGDERHEKQEARLNNLESRIKRLEEARGFDQPDKLT